MTELEEKPQTELNISTVQQSTPVWQSPQQRPSTYNPEQNARCRAFVLKAINAQPGSTYTQIRAWILEHYKFDMENVGARVRELATDPKYTPHLAKIVYDAGGHAFVYPMPLEVDPQEIATEILDQLKELPIESQVKVIQILENTLTKKGP